MSRKPLVGQEVVAALHLLDRPAEGVGRLLRVRDRLREQVREPVVLAHLDLLGVDEDQAHLVRRRAHQQRREDAVDAARLAGAGGAGDEQVRRRGEVEEHGLAGDVLADGDVERARALLRLRRHEQVAEGDELTGVVRHLDADRRLAGDRGEDAHVGGRHRVGDVLLQRRHPGDLHARAELELVARDRRADGHAGQRRVDPVLLQRLLQDPAASLDLSPVDRLGARAMQQRHGRQSPGPGSGAVRRCRRPTAGSEAPRRARRTARSADSSSPYRSSPASYGRGRQGEGDGPDVVLVVGGRVDLVLAAVVVRILVAAQRRQVTSAPAGQLARAARRPRRSRGRSSAPRARCAGPACAMTPG